MGRVSTSPDGVAWSEGITGWGPYEIWAVAWSEDLGLAVAVGRNGSHEQIATSPDGITWIVQPNPYHGEGEVHNGVGGSLGWGLLDVTWASELGLFIAVGTSMILTSPDGLNWTASTGHSFVNLAEDSGGNDARVVAYGPSIGIVVAGGRASRLRFAFSDDAGATWTEFDNDEGFFLYGSRASTATYVSGIGFVVGDGNGNVWTSTDGLTWSFNITGFAGGSSLPVQALEWSPTAGVFLATAWHGEVWTSPDAVTWTQQDYSTVFPTDDAVFALTWASGVGFLLIRQVGEAAITADGGSYSGPYDIRFLRDVGGGAQDVVWAPSLGLFIVVGTGEEPEEIFLMAGDDGNLATSPDAITWTGQTLAIGSPDPTIYSAEWVEDLHLFFLGMAFAFVGAVATAPDAVTWTRHTLPGSPLAIYNMAWGNDLMVVVGSQSGVSPGYIATSPDGVVWTERTSPLVSAGTNVIWGVAWSEDNGLFVAVAEDGGIITSPTGVTWTAQTPDSGPIQAVVWSPELSLFIYAGLDSSPMMILKKSSDGFAWTDISAGVTPFQTQALNWDSWLQAFVLGGGSNALWTSPDGDTWTLQDPDFGFSSLTDSVGSVAKGKSVALGYGGVTHRYSVSLYGDDWDGHNNSFGPYSICVGVPIFTPAIRSHPPLRIGQRTDLQGVAIRTNPGRSVQSSIRILGPGAIV